MGTGWLDRDKEYGQLVHESLSILRKAGARRELALCALFAASPHIPGDDVKREELLQEGLALSQETGFHFGTIWALQALGRTKEALRVSREANNRRGMARLLLDVGERAYARQEYARAKQLYQESMAAAQEIGIQWAIEFSASHLGDVCLALGEHAQALEYYRQALAPSGDMDHQPGILHALVGRGNVALAVKAGRAIWGPQSRRWRAS